MKAYFLIPALVFGGLFLLPASAVPQQTSGFAGQTCGPNGCNPVLPPPPPEATPIIRWAQARCGVLTANVTLLNETRVAVPSNPVIRDIALTANGHVSRPELRTVEPVRMIEPGQFADSVRYTGVIPSDLSGTVKLSNGPEPIIEMQLDTANPCP
jgi:hypothetical protein